MAFNGLSGSWHKIWKTSGKDLLERKGWLDTVRISWDIVMFFNVALENYLLLILFYSAYSVHFVVLKIKWMMRGYSSTSWSIDLWTLSQFPTIVVREMASLLTLCSKSILMNLSVIATIRYTLCCFQFFCFINAIIRLVILETEEDVTTTIILHEPG